MATFIFPGQGSQYQGMSLELFDEFREFEPAIDSTLGYSLKALITENPQGKLTQTEYTQPAIYVVSCFAFMHEQAKGHQPDYVLGHSLGEFSACFAAGIFDLITGLKIVKERGQIMSQQKGGAMLAVLGIDESALFDVLIEQDLISLIDVANYNAPTQFVLSGLEQDIKKAQECLTTSEAHVIKLPVSGAFHSRHLEQARVAFMRYLMDISFNPPQVPIFSSSTCRLLEYDYLLETLGYQITRPVQWTKTIEHLSSQYQQYDFKEIGPGQVLTKLVKQILN